MVHLHTRFTDPAAVETWDAWFRWREGDVLQDVTIDDTWWRVAHAIAVPEGAQAQVWAPRFAQAFSRWRVLPAEDVLRMAGTQRPVANGATPGAVLNVAEFISRPLGASPCLDRAGLVDAACLAVRLLDDAVLAGIYATPAVPVIEVGLMGVADALCKLRVHYASDAARNHAAQFAAALAEGCLRGTVELAEERGPQMRGNDCAALATTWRARGMPGELIERALVSGVRHLRLTALRPHPLLARLANGVCEGLVPPASGAHPPRRGDAVLQLARDDLREAMQPWIDAPEPEQPPPRSLASRSLAVNSSESPSH